MNKTRLVTIEPGQTEIKCHTCHEAKSLTSFRQPNMRYLDEYFASCVDCYKAIKRDAVENYGYSTRRYRPRKRF